MINYFRKVRHRLLFKNGPADQAGRLSKYLLYALGEIVLVVIGILIALQINNWNDHKKNQNTEAQYYCKIFEDLKLDKDQIENLKENADNRIRVSKEVLLELDSGNKDKGYILNKFLITIRSENYIPRNKIFQDLIASGNLKLLQDPAIKNSLIQYYSDLKSKQYLLTKNREVQIEEVYRLINSSIEFGIQEFDYINALIGPDILEMLPQTDWTKDKQSEFYKEFQKILILSIAMSGREIEHLDAINSLMEAPYVLLKGKCENV